MKKTMLQLNAIVEVSYWPGFYTNLSAVGVCLKMELSGKSTIQMNEQTNEQQTNKEMNKRKNKQKNKQTKEKTKDKKKE